METTFSVTDRLYAALDGMTVKLDGVSGKLADRTCRKPFADGSGRFAVYRSLVHEPDAQGRRHPDYVATKRTLGDDHYTELADSERLVDLASEWLGDAAIEALYVRPAPQAKCADCGRIYSTHTADTRHTFKE